MKKFLIAVVLSVLMVGSVAASTFTIYGGMIVSGSEIGTPVYVDLSNRGLWLSQLDCEAALAAYLKTAAKSSSSKADGTYPDPATWAVVIAKKTSFASCGKSSQ